ncbi:MAG: Uma2 family endonuclease [Gammaproteobacteria bacterium]|nr:Uma2 family endonuclease [Gammaproteobacteria bacterium]
MKTGSVLSVEDPMYPGSDGLPLAENDWQLRAILDAFGALDLRYLDRPDVYVSSDLLIYYEEGNPRKSVAPDVFIVFGAAKHKRMVYKLWEEPKAPDFVLEVRPKTPGPRTSGASAACTPNWACGNTGCSTRRTSTSIPRCKG